MARADAIEREIELALQPGEHVSLRDRDDFITQLERLLEDLNKLADPARAAVLLETFVAGCFEKANEVDDSGGSFANFVHDLFCSWIRARTKAESDRDETARRLLAWADKDDYALCYQFERDIVKAFDKAGLTAFEQAVHERLKDPQEARRAGEMLRATYVQQRNAQAYVQLCDQTETSQQDCLVIASMIRTRLEEKLCWVERGLAMTSTAAEYDLVRLKRELFTKLGREPEALEDAWTAYERYPSTFTYEELMRYVPKKDRATWHEKAINATPTDLGASIDLFLATKEVARLVELLNKTSDAQLESLSHYTTEPVAKKLEKGHPDVTARLYRALAVRILNARKAKYYDAALEHLENAKKCYERARLAPAWDALVNQIRLDHKRKTWFMQKFEKLATGNGPSTEPSFLERARKRWAPTNPDGGPSDS